MKFDARRLFLTLRHWAWAIAPALLMCSTPAAPAGENPAREAPQVWFNLTNYNMGKGVDGAEGWQVLSRGPGAAWPPVMDQVQVVAAAGLQQVPDEVLARMLAELKARRLPFAMESLAQSWVNQPRCGRGVESYYDPPGARKVAQRIAAAGGRLSFVAMDEPLFYGRYYGGPEACHSEIDNVAERAAAIMQEYQAAFPEVVIGDIEPIPALTARPDWRAEYRSWMAAFHAKTGKPIAFLQIDINWRQPNWPQSLREVTAFARAENLPFGIIYNGDAGPQVTSDAAWIRSGEQHVDQIEGGLGVVPDQAVFHSWGRFPGRSFTNGAGPGEDQLVEFYARHKAKPRN